MMIAPVIFCTLVLGVGSVPQAAQVGKVGGLALGYFVTMSSVALGIGLLVGNILKPGDGLNLTPGVAEHGRQLATRPTDRRLHPAHHPGHVGLVADRRQDPADPAGRAAGRLRAAGDGLGGQPVLSGIGHLQRLVFRILAMIMWAGPIGAFGAIAASSARPASTRSRRSP